MKLGHSVASPGTGDPLLPAPTWPASRPARRRCEPAGSRPSDSVETAGGILGRQNVITLVGLAPGFRS